MASTVVVVLPAATPDHLVVPTPDPVAEVVVAVFLSLFAASLFLFAATPGQLAGQQAQSADQLVAAHHLYLCLSVVVLLAAAAVVAAVALHLALRVVKTISQFPGQVA